MKLADAIQAYIQARLTGPPCWVELPEDAWPDDVDIRKFRRPVVRLVKALYGHPDAGQCGNSIVTNMSVKLVLCQ